MFTGDAHVNCFGCDVPTPCEADLVIHGVTHSGTARTTACVAIQQSGTMCLFSGTASGTVVGTSGTATGVELHFSWARMGAYALIAISGDSSGLGLAVFVAPRAACGGPVDATIAGWVVGV